MSQARKIRLTASEHATALDMARLAYPKGSVVRGMVTKVARDGMSRHLRFVGVEREVGRPYETTRLIAQCLDLPVGSDGLRVAGTGMDMHFSVVYDLARVLYGDGYALTSQPF